jgi:LysR family transcriptional regulator, transcriptional activator of the cysJI operon
MNIDLDRLCTFIQLAQEGSFTASGKSLRKSQSAVSLQIAGLESLFGLQLIDRSTRPIKLTEAGQLFLQFSTQIVNQTADLERTMRELARGVSGEVKIGATTSVGAYLLPPIAGELAKKHPKLSITIVSLPQATVLASVRASAVDFAFVLSDRLPVDLKVTTLKKEPLWFVSSPENALVKKFPLTPSDLKSIPFIVGLKGDQYTGMMESILEERRFPKVPIAMRIGNYEGIKQAVCAGIGIGILPRFTIHKEIRNRTLVRIGVDGVSLSARIMLVERMQTLQRPTAISAKSYISAAISKLQNPIETSSRDKSAFSV